MKYVVIVTAFVLGAVASSPGQAQPAAPLVDPAAVQILKAAGDRLASARTMVFTATATHDVPNAEGQSILLTERSKVEMQRPHRLRVITEGDGPRIEFLTDGRTMVLFRSGDGTVATAPAGATLDDTLRSEVQAFGQTQAVADMLLSDPAKGLTEGLTRAFVVGRTRMVGGVETDIVAFTAPGAQGQIWVGAKDRLPRQLTVTETDTPGRPRNSVTFSGWSLDRPIPGKTFSLAHTAQGKPVPFAQPGL
ncbi:DUF2092 domain-containing protein [Microvirga pudoricolor]|uniref:DUF2092 domain-containing protein n=1 Tax=Microvirga pudoricolor TaxID=2778729 RepID=UPI00194EEC5E|nr:DUF2092 domain-containing protein [Microvirga pudoricolor]MBM6595470.1 DUF2092 domain-containing protein [Microvirga pudoricolor]